MTYEYNSTPYEQELLKIGIKLGEPFRRAKEHHQLICAHCNHQWVATPLSKIQAYKKRGYNGCPECNKRRVEERNTALRQHNIQTVLDRGLEVTSDWDGRNSVGSKCHPLPVTVRNNRCGHTFTSNAVNLLRASVDCPICASEYKTSVLTNNSKRRSEEWQKTATEWKRYKSTVTKLTRQSYKHNKSTINPNNLPTGKAGTEGAYHIDHIVPIRFCYENNVPEETCAHHTNLQMLGWRENVGSRDKLKNDTAVPPIISELLAQV